MQKSIKTFPSLRGKKLFSNPEVKMFYDDIGNQIMPIRGRPRNNPDFEVQIIGDDIDICINILQSISNYPNKHNEEVLLSDAISQIGRELALTGRTTYEIIETEEGEIALANFIDLRLFRFFRYYVQVVPKNDWQNVGSKINVIEKPKVWDVQMPNKLGGVYKHRIIMEVLSKVKSFISSDWVNEIAKGNKVGIDVKEFDSIRKKFIYSLFNKWGWDARDDQLEQKNEYYKKLRDLRFSWALAILRQHILNKLNEFLEHKSINSEITLRGLPTPTDYKQAMQDLKNKKLDFSEVSNLTYL